MTPRPKRTRKPEELLVILKRFVPAEAWPKVEAAFAAARRLRVGERETAIPEPKAVGLLLDICEAATRELRHIQSLIDGQSLEAERRDDATQEPS